MLDLTKLARQLPGISEQMYQEVAVSKQRLTKAIALLSQAQANLEELLAKQKQWGDRLIFAAATPVEALDTPLTLGVSAFSHSVFATDGSQIAPSHHEIAYCYLLNIGRIMLHYGQNLHPLLDSLPEIYYKPEDLYISKKWGIRTEEWMGYRRTVAEAKVLAEMACAWVKPPGAHYEPNLALVDGSLIYWFLEVLPHEAKDLLLPEIFQAWSNLQEQKIPLVSYISAPRSSESINFLRLQACPYPKPNCQSQCGNLDKLPCQVVEPLRDATLWAYLLKPGERSPLWRSNLRILDLYPESYRVYFCYINVGTEIARVEMPAWVALDSTLLEQALGIVLAQVYKGYGYPIALAEAHNQAVVKSGDRARFFALLEDQMIRAGLKNVGISYKESSKRISIA
ncbi:DNA double-strand break repair nuclease NurA [Gloeocapsa sp. PCC 73106]|uniref:DNA double-strand break repair nuclease NurA n=1 Tax=Gloeocapsa sp. PCC 73106 TaxID=102232 RepID=UPI0002AB9F24|nr:DNA double-strand break repair nuclease NurA [Gloeocapsa sp. PCC 73106]ELR98203.1 NurA domain-containing protein [Gloeocapsa sp. PCC 73106]